MRSILLLLSAALAVTACSSSRGPTDDDDGVGPAATAAWTASFVPETAPGAGPAELRFVNQSSRIVTATLGGAAFERFDASDVVAPQLAVSADVAIDGAVGVHESKDPLSTCSFLNVVFGGAHALVPGAGYDLVIDDAGDSLAASVNEGAAPSPFVALRGFQDEGLPGLTTVELSIAGATTTFDISDVAPSAYTRFEGASVTIDAVTLVLDDGSRHEAIGPLVVEGASGFTVVLGPAAVPGAVATTPLGSGPG